MQLIIGIDFDNTIIGYDDLIHLIALEKKLIPEGFPKNKKKIRDHIRTIPGGEIFWQEIQAQIYGPRIQEAKIFAGFNQFLRKCHDNNITIYVISHKTIYSNLLQGGTNLREAALLWMEKNIFTNKLSKEQVFFGSTLDEKNKHINILQCTHFIDDLEEVFNASSFPTSVKKILFNSSGENKQISDVQVLQNWEKINNYFFSNRAANIES